VKFLAAILIALSVFFVPTASANPFSEPDHFGQTVLTSAQSYMNILNINDQANHRNLRGVIQARSTSTSCTITPRVKIQFGRTGNATIDSGNNYTWVIGWINGGYGQARNALTTGIITSWAPTECSTNTAGS